MTKDFWLSQNRDVEKLIEYAEKNETWTINSEEFQVCLEIFCERLQNFSCKSSDANFIKKFMEVLAVARFSYFIRILKNAEARNGSLIENLASHILKNEIPHAVGQVITCRTRYLIAIGVYHRVFSTDRLRLILQSLGA